MIEPAIEGDVEAIIADGGLLAAIVMFGVVEVPVKPKLSVATALIARTPKDEVQSTE